MLTPEDIETIRVLVKEGVSAEVAPLREEMWRGFQAIHTRFDTFELKAERQFAQVDAGLKEVRSVIKILRNESEILARASAECFNEDRERIAALERDRPPI